MTVAELARAMWVYRLRMLIAGALTFLVIVAFILFAAPRFRGEALLRVESRRPDAGLLGYDACFVAGLAKIETASPAYRPFKIVYASLYADVRPSFVVDITPFIEQRHAALMAYKSQYANQQAGGALFVPEEEIRERTFAEARHYGLLAGVKYGEPFVQKEVGLVDDLTLIPVQSI